MSLSIIIPTYNNVSFLGELFTSIVNNKYDQEYEVLIGIDSCEETLNYVYDNQFPDNFYFFYFLENGGPYLIKNTLADLSSFDRIFFFDSDDIMLPDLLTIVDSGLSTYDVVKPKYREFKDIDGERILEQHKPIFGEGVFGIKRDLFLSMNGFEGWKVAADSDFMARIYNTNKRVLHTSPILFQRRVHEKSLTKDPTTGLASQLRSMYFHLSKKKSKKDIILSELSKSSYKVIDVKNKELTKSLEEQYQDQVLSELEIKRQKHENLNSVFSSSPKNIVKPQIQKNIDYDKINKNLNYQNTSNLKSALKKAKLENIRKNFRG